MQLFLHLFSSTNFVLIQDYTWNFYNVKKSNKQNLNENLRKKGEKTNVIYCYQYQLNRQAKEIKQTLYRQVSEPVMYFIAPIPFNDSLYDL